MICFISFYPFPTIFANLTLILFYSPCLCLFVCLHEGISACSDAERCEEAVAAGMDGFLIKPFRLIDLIKVVKEYAANEKLKQSRKFLHDGISSL